MYQANTRGHSINVLAQCCVTISAQVTLLNHEISGFRGHESLD